MRPTATNLPKDDTELCRVVDEHASRERARYTLRRGIERMAIYYAQGFRRFTTFSPVTGSCTPVFLEQSGDIPLQVQEFLHVYNRVIGAMSAVDLKSLVTSKFQANTLRTLQDKAVMQAIADWTTDEHQLDEVQQLFLMQFAMHGSCGITGHLRDVPTLGLINDLEVVPSEEVLPFPSVADGALSRVRGKLRERWLSLDDLVMAYGSGVKRKSIVDKLWGAMKRPGEEDEALTADTFPIGNITASASAGIKDSYVAVRVRELWIEGEAGRLVHYSATSGDVVLERADPPPGQDIFCPLGWARFYENMTFHGSGLWLMLASLVRRFESLVKDAINATRDQSKYPILVMPSGQVNERIAFKEDGRGLKYMTVTEEARFNQRTPMRPFVVAPPRDSLGPTRASAYVEQLIDKYNPSRDLIREKGRGDSLPFMQFLEEESKKSINTPVNAMKSAFGAVYRSVASRAVKLLAQAPRDIPVGRVDLGLVGAVVDFDKGILSLDENKLPDIRNLKFTVRDNSARRESVRKAEAFRLFEVHQDVGNLVLFAIEEGLDLAMDIGSEKAAYDVVVRNIIRLFGDGEQPAAPIIVTPHTELPAFQLRVLNRFMGSSTMRLASVKVHNAFIAYRKMLIQYIGAMLPEMVPDPFDEALSRQLTAQGGGANVARPQLAPA